MPVRKKSDRTFSEQNTKLKQKYQEQTMGKSRKTKFKESNQPKVEARHKTENTNVGYLAVVFIFGKLLNLWAGGFSTFKVYVTMKGRYSTEPPI